MSLLELTDVTKTFDAVTAVADASLRISEGETAAIIGPNGAGKSTLFGVIAGEHRPNRGRVTLAGEDVTPWTASRLARAGVSRTFQVAKLFTTRTVRENLLLASAAGRGKSLRWWDRFGSDPVDRERVQTMLQRLGLEDLSALPAGVLPQGDRKRLEFAMALVQEPRLLLLDEPTAGMSLDDIDRTLDLLRTLRGERSELTVVVTAHDMDVVFALATRVLLMSQGRIVLEGAPSEIENHPLTREVYLGTVGS